MNTSIRPLAFYVDPTWRREGASHIPLLYPFWGNAFSKGTPLIRAIFDTYSFDTAYYRITDSLSEADAILLPYAYGVVIQKYPEMISDARRISVEHGKKLIIDTIGDIDYHITIPQVITLRYGGYRFLREQNDIVTPPYAHDLLERYCHGALQLRPKAQKPIVGFTGWAVLPPAQRARTITRGLPDRIRGVFDSRYRARKKGIFFRKQAIDILEHSREVEHNFIIRRSYSAHIRTASTDPETLRKQFVENALASDLGLDVRGDANASTRLFELLSLGRVPIILDTERNFPFSDELNYSEFALIVDFRDIHQLPQKVRAFYDALSEEKWRTMQEKARAAYRDWFRVDALTSPLMRAIRNKINN